MLITTVQNAVKQTDILGWLVLSTFDLKRDRNLALSN